MTTLNKRIHVLNKKYKGKLIAFRKTSIASRETGLICSIHKRKYPKKYFEEQIEAFTKEYYYVVKYLRQEKLRELKFYVANDVAFIKALNGMLAL